MDKPFEAYRGQDPYNFVSYAHADAALVFPAIERLHLLGYRIWYDEGIDPATIWIDEIHRALTHAAAVLLFLSPNANESEWVAREVHVAGRTKKPIIPVYLSQTKLGGELEMLLSRVQAVHTYRLTKEESHRLLERTILPETSDGSDSQTLSRRGHDLRSRGQFRQAIVCYSLAIERDRRNAEAYHGRAVARFQEHDYEGSSADFKQARKLAPDLLSRWPDQDWRFQLVCWIKKHLGRWGGRRAAKNHVC